jgi:hypothetical protein
MRAGSTFESYTDGSEQVETTETTVSRDSGWLVLVVPSGGLQSRS